MIKWTRAEKAIDTRIEKAYYASCAGVQISIWDMDKVMAVGRQLVASGADDDALKTGLRAFVETIRKD